MSDTNQNNQNPFEKNAKTPWEQAREAFKAREKHRETGRKLSSPAIRIIITLLFAAVYFYMALPALNPQSGDLYVFILLTLAVYVGMTVFATGLSPKATPDEVDQQIKRICKPAIIVAGVLLGVCLIGNIAGSVLFRSSAYTQLLDVQAGDFATEVKEISYDQIPMLDKASAERLGDRKLGELSDMVSQFEVTNNYIQINYKGAPVRVSTLEYGDVFKWLSNKDEGLPAYIVINMVTQNAEVVRLDKGMMYSTADHFGRNIYRKLRFDYPTYIFGKVHFEIDENGHPYWICPREVRTIGLFGGRDIVGAVILDAVTGESQYYAAGEIPSWVDQIYTADLIIEQYDYYGMYQKGFINSIIGQKNVTVTTDGYNYIAMGDDVYVYTGVTSVGGDESNIGFILCNQRTKEARYYACAGAEEYSARDSAEGVVQHLNYTSTFPLLLNVSGQPTYFMSLKDDAQLVKMYAMVNVRQYNIVATGTTLAECEANYIKLLNQNGVVDGTSGAEVSGVVAEIRTAVIDGNSYYYFRLEGEDHYYSVSAADSQLAVVVNVGDTIQLLSGSSQGSIRPASNLAIQ